MSRTGLLWIGCGAMLLGGGYWLWQNGNTNILSFALLLLCPLMHLFMHRGHSHGAAKESTPSDKEGAAESKKPSCH